MESPIVIDLWTVEEGRRDELIAAISDFLQLSVVGHRGFVSAEIYESTDGGSVIVSIRMRTAKDRQSLLDSADGQATYRELRAIADTHAHFYRLVESFGEAD